jgi:hypothetical protein
MMAAQKPQVEMPKQPPEERAHNFEEVALGYTEEMAVEEALRCLTCPNPQCIKGCPVEIDIPAFINLVKEKRFDEAIRKVKEKNALPAICGRVCPQEEQCQKLCVLGIRWEPIAVGRLERFVADWEQEHGVENPERPKITGGKVAIVGAGPAGLTVAAELASLGHEVEIFEALHTAGGVLMYGIPQFRLPKEIVQAEVDYVRSLGAKINLDAMVGRLHRERRWASEVPPSPRREPEGRLLGQRVPHPDQPDEGVQVPGVRHPDRGREGCGGHRRRQRRHGLGPLRSEDGSGEGLPRLPQEQEGDAREA